MAEKKVETKKTTKAAVAKKAAAPVEATVAVQHKPRTLTGIVISDKMMKTRVVKIERPVKNRRYGKYLTSSNNVKIHDENNVSHTGDLVSIVETRPLSKDKRYALQKILRKGNGKLLTVE